MTRILVVPVLLLFGCFDAGAQSRPAFEVVSIKPVPRPTPETVRDGTSRVGFNIIGDRVEIAGYGLNVLVARAFRVENAQVDLRSVAGADFYEIQAKLPEGAGSEQIPEMLQTMLAERFKLTYHREMREYPVTIVTVGKNGMKLARLPDGTPESSSTASLADGATRFTLTGTLSSLFPVMNSSGRFAQMVDQTGLEGVYTWVRDVTPVTGNRNFSEVTHESFEAMMDAAGLKLEARKMPKETIVVDSAERAPTEN